MVYIWISIASRLLSSIRTSQIRVRLAAHYFPVTRRIVPVVLLRVSGLFFSHGYHYSWSPDLLALLYQHIKLFTYTILAGTNPWGNYRLDRYGPLDLAVLSINFPFLLHRIQLVSLLLLLRR